MVRVGGMIMNNEIYRSEYEAYPFLADDAEDLRCDFELLTDEIASLTAFLSATVIHDLLSSELLFITELVYHLNPSLRTKITVTENELVLLLGIVNRLEDELKIMSPFVLPQGSQNACMAHVLRVKCKMAARILYKHAQQGNSVDNLIFDFINLLSGYFFFLAIKLNEIDGYEEIEFVSRSY